MNKLFSSLLLNNAKTNQPSYTTTAFIIGFGSITIKLFISGLIIHGYKMSDVSVTDWAAGVAALSAMWISNKHINNLQINKQNCQTPIKQDEP